MNIKKIDRIKMSEKLGRPLKKNEQVFHLSGDKVDNRPDNLVFLSDVPKVAIDLYKRCGIAENRVKYLERELKELRADLPIFKHEKNDEKLKTDEDGTDWIKIDRVIRGVS